MAAATVGRFFRLKRHGDNAIFVTEWYAAIFCLPLFTVGTLVAIGVAPGADGRAIAAAALAGALLADYILFCLLCGRVGRVFSGFYRGRLPDVD